MAIYVNDPAYFGHFNIDILKKMEPNLTELELLVWQGEIYSRNRGETYLQGVIGDIRHAMEMDPDWRGPDVKIVDRKTGKLVERILGGALISTKGAGSRP
jgi:hypothetical protein